MIYEQVNRKTNKTLAYEVFTISLWVIIFFFLMFGVYKMYETSTQDEAANAMPFILFFMVVMAINTLAYLGVGIFDIYKYYKKSTLFIALPIYNVILGFSFLRGSVVNIFSSVAEDALVSIISFILSILLLVNGIIGIIILVKRNRKTKKIEEK